jgi:hypothetical protein
MTTVNARDLGIALQALEWVFKQPSNPLPIGALVETMVAIEIALRQTKIEVTE